jgi:hypothetical protein
MENLQSRAQIPRRSLHGLLAGKEEGRAESKEEVMLIALHERHISFSPVSAGW